MTNATTTKKSVKIVKRALGYQINGTISLDDVIGSIKTARKLYNDSLAIQWLVNNFSGYTVAATNKLPSMQTSNFKQKAFYSTVKNIIINLAFFTDACNIDEAIAVGNALITSKSYTIIDFADYALASITLKCLFQDAVAYQIYK